MSHKPLGMAGSGNTLQCPGCKRVCRQVVKDSRPMGEYTRRRRQCACGRRFTTTERIVSDAEFWKVMERAGIGARPV